MVHAKSSMGVVGVFYGFEKSPARFSIGLAGKALHGLARSFHASCDVLFIGLSLSFPWFLQGLL